MSSGDDELAAQGLEKLGYKQELTRRRGLAHILFMTLAIMAVRASFLLLDISLYNFPMAAFGLAAPIATSLIGGGPATMIWGWIMISLFTQPLALSLAEVCSKYPTSAGAYYWCFRLGSPRRRLLLSWINGWLTMVGVWTISLSVTFGTTQILIAGINIFHPEWVATTWQTYLIFLGVTAFATAVGIFFNRLLPSIDILSACWTFLGIIIILICLSVKAAAGRRSASFALGHFDPTPSGWTPGWAYFIGLLPVIKFYSARSVMLKILYASLYLFCDWHDMAEEVHNPSVQVPTAMAWSIPIGAVCGVVFLLPITFTLPDIGTLLSVPGGQPIGVMFELVMGSKGGGFGIWFIIFGIGVFCAISICCAASRATWSFARDLNAYLLSTAIQVLLGLINLGSSAAFNAFVGVAVICLGASYAMPVAISLAHGRRDMVDAPFSLGRWGFLINAWAVIWVLFEIVLFSMPAVIPATQVSMNYASVVFVGFGAISAIWYLINGRYHYHGPSIPEDDLAKVVGNNSSQTPSMAENDTKEKREQVE
ncbi:amino acid transporter [Cyathus striatus]|nr:amino acid transporter [Cyathus striatus]